MSARVARFVCVATLLLGTAALAARPRPPAAPVTVTLAALLAAPESYHGKRIQVSAWLSLSTENQALCPAADTPTARDCVWVDIDNGPAVSDKDNERVQQKLQQWQACGNRRVTLTGRFDAMDQGLLGLWAASLKDVISVEGEGCSIKPRKP